MDSATETKNPIWAEDLRAGREVLLAEGDALRSLGESLDEESFGRAIDILIDCPAQIVLTGMGKSGHIAAKIAATLASTGSPAFFMHPGEALHGDLGMLTPQSVVVAFSQSGATDEVVNLLPYIKSLTIPLIAITGNEDSVLGRRADVVLSSRVDQEACPLNLAPTTSTTLQLALGDAVAIALMNRRGFGPEDFALRHPLGSLGRRLLVKVSDLMHREEENPTIHQDSPLHEAISKMTGKRLGAVSVINGAGKLSGIFCDGDLRRLFGRMKGKIDSSKPIGEFMIKNPKRTRPDILGAKAVDEMETHSITVLPVVDDSDRPIGMIHLHDLIRAGISP